MTEEQILQKVESYLKITGNKWKPNSLRYLGLKGNARLPDGSTKSMHIVAYDIESEAADGNTFFVYADAKTNKLNYLVTPHRVIDIDE